MSHHELSHAALLRQRAEGRLNAVPLASRDDRASDEAMRLLHELQVHQVELELQNEELLQSRLVAERALAQYTELYEFSPVGYFTFDRTGVILNTNAAGSRMLGPDARLLVGQRFRRFMTAATLMRFEALLQRVFTTRRHQSDEMELVGQRDAPYIVLVEAALSPDAQTCLASVVDISDRKALDQARARAASLEVQRQVAEAGSQAKSMFLSRMSHELRTPLNAMLGFTQLLQMDGGRPLDEQQTLRAQAVMQAGWHLLRLIDDVLDLPAIESGEVVMAMTPLDLTTVLAEAAQLVAPLLRTYDVSLEWVPELEESGWGQHLVMGDRTRLVQVFSNLLSNAIKYNKSGGAVRILVDTDPAGLVGIGVVDTGMGLNPDQLKRIFQPFNRLGQEQSGIPGTGLGLVITKRLVELMGGTLSVQSTPGQGSRFDVQLVRAAMGATQIVPPADAVDRAPAADGQSLDVLYIEDNDVNARLMSDVVALRPGCQVHVATSMADGEALAARLRPKLVMLDLNLPDAQGVGVLHRLRQIEALKDAKVVVVSADASASHVDAAMAAGAHGYMTKPIKVTEVLKMLDQSAAN